MYGAVGVEHGLEFADPALLEGTTLSLFAHGIQPRSRRSCIHAVSRSSHGPSRTTPRPSMAAPSRHEGSPGRSAASNVRRNADEQVRRRYCLVTRCRRLCRALPTYKSSALPDAWFVPGASGSRVSPAASGVGYSDVSSH